MTCKILGLFSRDCSLRSFVNSDDRRIQGGRLLREVPHQFVLRHEAIDQNTPVSLNLRGELMGANLQVLHHQFKKGPARLWGYAASLGLIWYLSRGG